MGMQDTFREIYNKRLWQGNETRSGRGSTLKATAAFRDWLFEFVGEQEITSIVDAACGDFNYMRTVLQRIPIVRYTGLDIVPEAVEECNARYGNDCWRFEVADITGGALPGGDLMIMKDVIQHLSVWDAFLAIDGAIRSTSTWLVVNHCPIVPHNRDTYEHAGGFYNLMNPPFCLPAPRTEIRKFPEPAKQTPKMQTVLGLWELDEVRDFMSYRKPDGEDS